MDLEQFGVEREEEQKQAAREAAGKPEEKEGPDLKELLADKRMSVLFTENVRVAGAGDALQEYLSGSYDDSVVKELGAQVKDFNELMDQAEGIQNMLDGDALENIVKASPELQEILKLNKGAAREVVAKYIPDLAVRDKDKFERIAKKMEALERTRKRSEPMKERIEEFCNEYGITLKDYYALHESGRKGDLEELVRSKFGFWKKVLDKKGTEAEIAREISSLPDTAAIDKFIAQCKRDRKGIGDALAFTLVDSDTVKKAVSADTQGLKPEEMPGAEEMSFPDALKTVKEAGKEFKDKKVLDKKFNEWLDKKTSRRGKTRREGYQIPGGGFDIDQAHADFAESIGKEKMKGKKGLVAVLMKTVLFPNFFDRLW